jgi:type IV pilus assembly protein PilQ
MSASRNKLQFFVLLLFIFSFVSEGKELAELKGINFKQKGEVSELELLLDENQVVAKKFHVVEDKQIIIDLEGVRASDKVMRSFDTSEFNGSVVFVSAYKKPGENNNIRIALQLRDNSRSVLKRKENRISLEVENRFGVFSQSKVSAGQTFQEKIEDSTEELGRLNVPKSDTVEDILENLTLSGRKKYIGDRISLDVKDVPVADILKMVSEASGFNIILTKEINDLPSLSLNLTNVPWDQVLDTVLSLNKLVARKNGIILMVQTLANATKDKEEEIRSKKASVKQETLVTKIFPISYANTKELSVILKPYLTVDRGELQEDVRTNSLIVKDIPDVIEKIRKIVDVLDAQTPQVLIESKIVEVQESYAKRIGLERGVSFGYDPVGTNSNITKDATAVGLATTAGNDGGPGFSISSAPTGDASTVFGLSVAQFHRLTNLDFRLSLLETERKAKIIGSPKVITQNKKKAKISSTTKDFFAQEQAQAGSDASDIPVTFVEQETSVSLEVTPQVTNEGAIILDIDVQKSDFGARISDQGPRTETQNKLNTQVLVENGSTIVLGGLYEYARDETHSGIPFLKDIPLIGWLFRTPYAPSVNKREVIIFLTPRIINQEAAGLVDKT